MWFSSQENNAIAVIDMQTETFVDMYGLGFKNWQDYTLDPSDRDDGNRILDRYIHWAYNIVSLLRLTNAIKEKWDKRG